MSFEEIDEVIFTVSNSVYGRYEGISDAENGVIYTQDDDCITDIRPILDAYESGLIVNAMTPEHAAQYRGRVSLVGFGAIFDRSLVDVLDGWERDELFLRECDRVFTGLNRRKTVYPSIRMLPQATAENRMYREPGHNSARAEIERRIQQFAA